LFSRLRQSYFFLDHFRAAAAVIVPTVGCAKITFSTHPGPAVLGLMWFGRIVKEMATEGTFGWLQAPDLNHQYALHGGTIVINP
jgi:hypothetical protein